VQASTGEPGAPHRGAPEPGQLVPTEFGAARLGPRPHAPVQLTPGLPRGGVGAAGTATPTTGEAFRARPAGLPQVSPPANLARFRQVLQPPSVLRRPWQQGPAARSRKSLITSQLKSRSTMIRLGSLVCAAAVVIIAGVTGVGQSDPSVTTSVKAFLLAWENRDYGLAATLTTGHQQVVASVLRNAYSQLGAADLALGMGPIRVHGDTAIAYFNAEVDLGRGGRPWKYVGHFTLRRHGSTWLVAWSPSVVVPGLGAGDRLAVLTKVPPRAPLLDSSGKPLILRSTAVEVGVRPGRVKNPVKTATKLAKITGLASSGADQIAGQILAAPPNRFLELVQLSPRRFSHMSRALGRVPNLTHQIARKRLFKSAVPAVTGQVGTEVTRELIEDGSPYRPGTTVGLSGLQETYQATLAGTATTEVVVQNAKGHLVKVLKRWSGQHGTPVRTTIDLRVQRAARRALAGLGYSGAAVAVQAKTGRILAVAERQAGGMPDVDPLTGRYQPGQAFTIVPTAALLSKDRELSPNAQIPCWLGGRAGTRNFVNVPPVPKLGPPRFSSDFAHACTTAFVHLSLLLNGAELQGAAEQFGIGVPWKLPLQPAAFVGSIDKPANVGETAADAIGTGTVLVSPLDMALAAGVVDSGSWHQPSIVTRPSGPTLTSGEKVPLRLKTHVVSQLQQLMAGTVTSGAARAARLSGSTLYGQVGIAPLPGHPKLRAVWFVGFRGGVAFAVVAFTRSATYASAVQLAHDFAKRLPDAS
jgi:cell division protein FtsI/penicillin-binding protein 2